MTIKTNNINEKKPKVYADIMFIDKYGSIKTGFFNGESIQDFDDEEYLLTPNCNIRWIYLNEIEFI